jgi:hypothetical protein
MKTCLIDSHADGLVMQSGYEAVELCYLGAVRAALSKIAVSCPIDCCASY